MYDPLCHYVPGWFDACAHNHTFSSRNREIARAAAKRFSDGVSIILLNERLAAHDDALRAKEIQ